jgi:hypothetical protein
MATSKLSKTIILSISNDLFEEMEKMQKENYLKTGKFETMQKLIMPLIEEKYGKKGE